MFKTWEEIRRFDKPPWLGRIYMKGRRAAEEGKKQEDNPYGNDVNPRGGVNFNRARWRAWNKGYEDYSKEIKEANHGNSK